ncbi:complement C1q-like protein 2 [Ruditapes philippinarum]|uniref:complement C1q-like protein 2 n=1 Tax=Ruditapes philippinarum TaxID=129788 RepID=UPI00295B1C85|nr:complement C1q-like protein 2 [Ruditapes philippinarum]
MAILKSVFVLLLVIFTSWEVVSSEFENENISEFVTKDEMNKVLELVKLQDQKLSELKTEMKRKHLKLDRFVKRVADLEVRVLKQSRELEKIGAHDEIENERLRGIETKLQRTSDSKKDIFANFTFNAANNRAGNREDDPEHTIIEGGTAGNEIKQRIVATSHNQRRAIQAQVAFSAYLSYFQEHLGIHQTVKFDKIITNDGNAYNAVTGIFTVPVTGTYVFIFYINSSNSIVEVRLIADNSIIASGTSRPYEFNQSKDVQGGGTVVLHLNQGVSVWIENARADSAIYSNDVDRWVTFSGFLLY